MKIEFEADRQVLRDAITTWGDDLQELIAIEEMAELTKALVKFRRKFSSNERQGVVDEIADVQIMIWQLAEMYDRIEVQEAITKKMERLKSRLDHDFSNSNKVEG